MILKGISSQIPSQKISNQEVLELIKFYSLPLYNGNINDLEIIINNFFKATGIKNRFWRKKGEKSINLIEVAVTKALKMASLNHSDIDLVIYSSIDRGFIEPANASIISNNLGINHCRSFDVVDACMGWCTATQVAQSFLETEEKIKNVLIISSECPMDKDGAIFPENFKIKNHRELQWKASSYTIGEAVTATIFGSNKYKNKYFFVEKPEYADLCTIPLFNFEQYTLHTKRISGKKNLQFSAYGKDLSMKGMKYALNVLELMLNNIDYHPALIFPHSVSNRVIDFAANSLNVSNSIYSTFTSFGNLATSSIPSAIDKAVLNNEFKKGQRAIGWVASAGMKFSAFEITF